GPWLSKPVGCRLEAGPTGNAGCQFYLVPLGMPGPVGELIDLSEELAHELGEPLLPRRVLRPPIGDQQRPVRNRRYRRPFRYEVRIVGVRELRRQIVGEDR